ncbi:MAG: hypothetical protein ABIQ75_07400, partial [Flavobacteriales bacterium]
SGGYATPVKLAGYINTAEDEDYAVMAADGTTFYFCSKGHNSMGGYDVFKSTFDKGMDAFGAPENMDFAVNTPADELLYIVGPDGKQACFASNRDSKQGMLNVYRVGTKQTPINITVLKGTYASAFDPSDRKAHIIVEDALTRERVADVNTDMNGSYLLALPRGGKYKFLVEGGPKGMTHLATVDVPPNDRPKVYKQEIELVDNGGEKVAIKNYFDQPLEDDVMALALNEIRRRAKLDVTGEKAVEKVVAQVNRSEEPLQAAGFDGTMTMTKAQELARNDATRLKALAEEKDRQANAAYDMALKNVTTAEAASKRAQDLIQQADRMAKEDEKDPLMRQAAEAKQLSHEANERARAAYRTARDLETSGKTSRSDAATADVLARALTQAQMSGDRVKATTALKELKARIDVKNGPDGEVDEAERTRRAATATELEASKKMKQATAQREDELQLTERIGRLQREAATAKGRKKEDINGQISVLEAQRSALHDEVNAAFAKAQDAEDGAAVARGQAQLVRYLNGDQNTWKEQALPENELAGMEQRLSNVRAGNKALAIDERYAPLRVGSADERERRTFDWGTNWSIADLLNGNYLAVSKSKNKTDGDQGQQAADLAMSDQKDAAPKSEENRKADTVDQGRAAAGTAGTASDKIVSSNSTTIPDPPVTDGTEAGKSGNDRSTNTTGNDKTGDLASRKDQSGSNNKDGSSDASGRGTSSDRTTASGKIEENANRTADKNASENKADAGVGGTQANAADKGTGVVKSADGNASNTATTGNSAAAGTQDASKVQVLNQAGRDADNSAGKNAATSDRDRNDDLAGKEGGNATNAGEPASVNADEQAFILANKLAELEQLRKGEKSKAKRDSLDRVIADQRELIGTYQSANTGTAGQTTPVAIDRYVPMEYRPLEFDLSMMDEQLVEEAYPGFVLRKKAITDGPGNASDKANMLHALEMELVDSIDVQTTRNLAVLDQHPELADLILPRLERWRQLKAVHVDSASAALAGVDKEYIASETKAMEDAQLSGQAIKQTPTAGNDQATTPHNDAYVNIASDLSQIYSSSIAPRSKKNAEAVALKDKELEQVSEKLAEIDSLEGVLTDTPGGKNYEKLRKDIDKRIDDVLIQNVELGQRMVFISNSEYDVAKDSAKVLEKSLSRMGLPPNAPLLQMVRSYQGAADEAMGKAKGFRKDADRTGDIVQRNSLYRQAYGEELKALRDYDRSLTVRNYLLSGQAIPGEALTYEQVEERMFKPAVAVATAPDGNSGKEDQTADVKTPTVAVVDTLPAKPVQLVSVVSSGEAEGRAQQDGAASGQPV